MARNPQSKPGRSPRKPDRLAGRRRRLDLHMRQLGFELAIFDPAKRLVHVLNPVAAAIWHHVTPGRTTKNIAEVISLAYFMEDDPHLDEVTGDVVWILDQFAKHGLLAATTAKPPEPRGKDEETTIRFPDREIGALAATYVRPAMRSYTLDELEEKFHLESAVISRFSDTWEPRPRPDPRT